MMSRVWLSHGIWLRFDEEVMGKLREYAWPGNVRELSNLVERLAVIRPNGEVRVMDLPRPLRPGVPEPDNELPVVVTASISNKELDDESRFPEGGIDLKIHLAGVEKKMIESALDQSEGVVQRAAELLGVGRTTLVEKIRRHGLRP